MCSMSPGLISRAGLAGSWFHCTRPSSQALAASTRVLKKRAAQSHLSMRTPFIGSSFSSYLNPLAVACYLSGARKSNRKSLLDCYIYHLFSRIWKHFAPTRGYSCRRSVENCATLAVLCHYTIRQSYRWRAKNRPKLASLEVSQFWSFAHAQESSLNSED